MAGPRLPPAPDSSLMTLMGISVVVPIASKGISEYKKLKPRNYSETYTEPDYASMLEEKGQPSLLRVQMFLWTLAALAIYFWPVPRLRVCIRGKCRYPLSSHGSRSHLVVPDGCFPGRLPWQQGILRNRMTKTTQQAAEPATPSKKNNSGEKRYRQRG